MKKSKILCFKKITIKTRVVNIWFFLFKISRNIFYYYYHIIFFKGNCIRMSNSEKNENEITWVKYNYKILILHKKRLMKYSSVRPFIYLFIHLFVHSSICLSIHPFIYSSIYLSIHSFICLPIHPSIHPFHSMTRPVPLTDVWVVHQFRQCCPRAVPRRGAVPEDTRPPTTHPHVRQTDHWEGEGKRGEERKGGWVEKEWERREEHK